VVGQPHFLAAQSTPEPNWTWSFFVAFYPLRTQCSYAWNGKILRRRSGSLPLKSLNLPPSPSLLFQSFLHLLSCHGSLQCLVHCCHREDDPSIERDTSRQGHIMYASHINRLGEGLRHCKGGHRRSRRTIGDDGWPAGHYWWPVYPTRGGSTITCVPEFPCYPGSCFTSCSCAFPSSEDRERAMFNHAHASFYGCPHPEEDHHSASVGASIKQ
jgi:hypothetical protein